MALLFKKIILQFFISFPTKEKYKKNSLQTVLTYNFQYLNPK